MLKDYYRILGLDRQCTPADIRIRWRILARRFHPDHNPENPSAEEQFKEILEAYKILSDPSLKIRYDLGLLDTPRPRTSPTHYFYATCHEKQVRCFEEIHLSYTYSGNGRMLTKPSLTEFFITGSPYVAHRNVLLDGNIVKETHITYILCPLSTGELVIGKSSITIDAKRLESSTFQLTVTPNHCRFTHGNNADGKPFRITMHYEFMPGEEPFRISEKKKNHVLLVPRSRTARYFHNIGSANKCLCTLYGLVQLSQYFAFNFLIGMAVGNLIGGILCTIMYRMAGVKSKYSAAAWHPLVQEYRDRGYLLGESPGLPFRTGDYLYLVSRWVL